MRTASLTLSKDWRPTTDDDVDVDVDGDEDEDGDEEEEIKEDDGDCDVVDVVHPASMMTR